MTRPLLIPFYIIFSLNAVYSDEFKPSETLDYFCPCKLTTSCTTVFGEGSSGHVYKDILKSIPQCLTGTVRCCSKQVMFTALMIILSDHEVEFNDKARTPAEALEVKSKQGRKFFLPAIAPEAPLSQNGPGRALTFDGSPFKDILPAQGLFFNAVNALSQVPIARNLPQGVECVPLNQCNNVYGTKPEHFAQHGIISPIENNCFSDSGNILCVMDIPVVPSPPGLNPPPGSNPAPSPNPTPAPLPCTLPGECSIVYGTDGSHFTTYGIQEACPGGNTVRCVTPSATTPPTLPVSPPTLPTLPRLPTLPNFPPVLSPTLPGPEVPSLPAGAALSCLPVSSCSEVYGTLPQHFASFGIQEACPVEDQIRCVTPSNSGGTHTGHGSHGGVHTPTDGGHSSHGSVHGSHGGGHGSHGGGHTPTNGGHGSHGVDHSSHGGGNIPTNGGHGSHGSSHGGGHISTGLPVGPVAPSVSIIGPQPVYVTYNNIKGPSVGGDNSLWSAGQVDSSGVNPNQEAQINLLLQALKSKLSGIING